MQQPSLSPCPLVVSLLSCVTSQIGIFNLGLSQDGYKISTCSPIHYTYVVSKPLYILPKQQARLQLLIYGHEQER